MSKQFNYDSIKIVHLEATTTCNAACPKCARTDPRLFDVNKDKHELSLNFVKSILPIELVSRLDKVFMCGSFGDPAAAKDTIRIFKWLKEINPSITLGINTNGGLRTASWWQELAEVLSGPKDFVVFSIDGLEDTNHLYRVNVIWDKVIENACAFIDAGGKAHWDMLVFPYNTHQIVEAQKTAKQLGFKWFRSKVSRRDDSYTTIYFKNITRATPCNITCSAMNEDSIYITANGLALPCCFISPETFKPNSAINSLFSLSDVDLHKYTIKQAMETYSVISGTWNNSPYYECARTCIQADGKSPFQNQWKSEIQL